MTREYVRETVALDGGGSHPDPYLCSLAASYASFTAWDGVAHPSLPNYLALTSGSTQGCTSDNCKGPYTSDLGAQLTTAGVPWTAYMESMKTACSAKNANPYSLWAARPHPRYGAAWRADIREKVGRKKRFSTCAPPALPGRASANGNRAALISHGRVGPTALAIDGEMTVPASW
jgi:hypothetical protein